MKRKLLVTLFWITMFTAAIFGQLGIGGRCLYTTWCTCTMESHMFQAWCGGSGFSAWCYNNNHYCQYGGY